MQCPKAKVEGGTSTVLCNNVLVLMQIIMVLAQIAAEWPLRFCACFWFQKRKQTMFHECKE